MQCPACKRPMIVLEVDRIEVDHCLDCGGVWLDAGELELLLETATNRDELLRTLAPADRPGEKRIRCPICSTKLDKLVYGVRNKTVLDVCPKNHGLWFDRGELLQVLEAGEFPSGKNVFRLLDDIFGKERT